MKPFGENPSPEFVADLLETMEEGVVLHDPSGVVIGCNPAAERLLGTSCLVLPGRRVLLEGLEPMDERGAAMGPEDEPACRALRTGERTEPRRVRIRRADGEPAWLAMRAVPLRVATGPAAGGALTLISDQSERVLTEQRLSGEMQMDTFSELAGRVAHDFNHHLTVIVGYSDLLVHALPAGDAAREHADHVNAAAVAAARLTRELLDFSTRQRRPTAVANLVAAIEGMQPLLARLFGPHIRLTLDLDRDHAWVRADSAQIERVLFNLALNARDAMHGRGELTLTTRPVLIDEAFVRAHPGAQAGRFVRLRVRDDGEGMSAETRARLFEPYFTTKPPGRGTGLGLASVWGVVKQFGGYIEVESEPGEGAEFRIDLPEHAEAADRRVAVR